MKRISTAVAMAAVAGLALIAIFQTSDAANAKGRIPLAVARVQPSCAPAPLGVATSFNLFVLGDLAQRNASSEGRLAVGGQAALENYSAGAALGTALSPADVVVVGGPLTFRGGVVSGGDAVAGGPAAIASVSFASGGGVRSGSVLDFEAASAALRTVSAAYGALPATGATATEYGQITLTGADPTLNVFTVAAADLAVANSVTVRTPPGATALVNVRGAGAWMRSMGIALAGTDGSRVLYNFPDATALTIDGVGVEGSVLAPYAAVAFNNGVIDGTLVAASLTGAGQANLAPFAGCLPPA